MTAPIRVFLAEDSRFDVRAFQRHMRTWERPFSLEIATDGKAACDYVESDDPVPDIAILDLNMPKISGFEVLRRIRASDRMPDLPCIVLSTSASPEDRRRCAQLRANAFLVKTAEARPLIEAIERNIREFL